MFAYYRLYTVYSQVLGFTGGKGVVVQAPMPFASAEGDDTVSDPPAASETGAVRRSHDRLHGPGGLVSLQRLQRTRRSRAHKYGR